MDLTIAWNANKPSHFPILSAVVVVVGVVVVVDDVEVVDLSVVKLDVSEMVLYWVEGLYQSFPLLVQ